MWYDSIGGERPDGCGFVAKCHCGAWMHTHSLSGVLEFNEHGWGVWSQRHSFKCVRTEARTAFWQPIPNADRYFKVSGLIESGKRFHSLAEMMEV